MMRVGALSQTLAKSLRANFAGASATEGKAPKIENIRKGWDSWALKYAISLEPHNYPSQVSLMGELAPDANSSVLEVACGSGYFGAMYGLVKPGSMKYTMVDLSPKMLEIAKIRMYLTLRNGTLFQDVDHLPQVRDADIEQLLKSQNIQILETAAENMAQFEDNSFDVYIGGLFLHLVPDPLAILKEAYRLVKPGGKIGFSVFGDADKSLYFSLFDKIVKKEGHVEFRSKFHLADESKLKNLVAEAGFKGCKTMRQDVSFGIKSPEEADEHFKMPANRAILKQFDETTIERMKQELRSSFKEALEDHVIGVQNLLVVATK